MLLLINRKFTINFRMDGKRIAAIRHHLHSFLFSSRHSFHYSTKPSLVEEEETRSCSSRDHQKTASRTTIEVDNGVCPKITILPAYSKYLRHDQLRREQERQILSSSAPLYPLNESRFEDSFGGQEIHEQKSSSVQLDDIKSKVELRNCNGRSATPDTNFRFPGEVPHEVGIVPTYVRQGNGQSDSWQHHTGPLTEKHSLDGSFGRNNDEEANLLEKSSERRVSEETVRNFFDDSIMTSFKDCTVRDISVSDVPEN